MQSTAERTVDCYHEGHCLTARLYHMGERAVVLNANPVQEAAGDEHILPVQRRIWWMAQRLAERDGVIDAVPGMNNLTLVYDPLASKPTDWLEVLGNHWEFGDEIVDTPATITLPVHYGGEHGPDLGAVARHAGLSEQEVIDLHCDADYLVLFLGFQPGFAYLDGLSATLHMPRKESPALSVPAGSVAIGGQQTAVYPFSSPGGWHIIGHCKEKLFDPGNESPTLMLPGDNVKFIAVNSP